MNSAILRTVVVAIVLSAAQTAASRAADVSFAGKTVRVIVNFAAGGPSDIFARHYQKHLSRYLPGHPNVIVENRPGAAGMLAANYLYNLAQKDGLTVGSLTAIAAHPILGKPNVKFDITRFKWLGAVPQTQVLMVSTKIGIRSPADLLNPTEPLIYGTTGVNAAYVNTRLFLELIGARFKAVSGYRGQVRAIQALRRGEVNVTDLGISGYLPNRETYRKEGAMVALLQRGVMDEHGKFHRLPALSDLPTMEEVIALVNPKALTSAKFEAIKAVLGTYHIQFGFMLPPGTPQALVDAYRAGYAKMFRDPAIRKETRARFKVDHDFVDGASAQRYVQNMFAKFAANKEVQRVIRAVARGKRPPKAKK